MNKRVLRIAAAIVVGIALTGCAGNNTLDSIKATVNNNFHKVSFEIAPAVQKTATFENLALVDSLSVSYNVRGTITYPKSCRNTLELHGKFYDENNTVLYSAIGNVTNYTKGEKSNFEMVSNASNKIGGKTIQKVVIDSVRCS